MRQICVIFTLATALAIMLFAHAVAADVATNYHPFVVTGTYTATDGAILYKENCQSCHMPAGVGVRTDLAMYPALADNAAISPEYVTFIIFNGLRGMPSLEQYYTDAQVAAIATYCSLRLHKGTEGISAAAVKEMRPEKAIIYVD